MKNILLLTDFSDNSRNAIEYALEFLKGNKYNFFILNVHKVSKYTTADLISSSKDETIYDSIVKNPKAELNKMIEEYKQSYSCEDYLFKSICDYDTFVSAVKQTVNLQAIDLIIMGTNGATGAMEVIFGSNTVSVIRNIDCQVLVIPQGFRFTEVSKILFTIEFNETINEDSLKILLVLIEKYQTELDILILNKEDILPDSLKIKKNQLNSFFEGIKLNFYTITNVRIDFAMNCFEQIKKVDLIATIINKESFLKRLVSGSKTDNITYESRVPLLIMHSK